MKQSMVEEDVLVQQLQSLARATPELKQAASVYEAILPLLRDADLGVSPVALSRDEAIAKMDQGLPLLTDLDLEIDMEAARRLMISLADALVPLDRERNASAAWFSWLSLSGRMSSAAAQVKQALEDNSLDMGTVLQYLAAGEKFQVRALARSINLDPAFVLALAQNAFNPALRAWQQQLAPVVEGATWDRGTCYICGNIALFGELQENGQAKHLRCGHCGADWSSRRLRCVHCGNEDHTTRPLLYTDEGRERMYVEACDRCKGYLKVIAAFSPTPVDLLAVWDLATVPLDHAARERGYRRKE